MQSIPMDSVIRVRYMDNFHDNSHTQTLFLNWALYENTFLVLVLVSTFEFTRLVDVVQLV